jgi:rare lipoprotein A
MWRINSFAAVAIVLVLAALTAQAEAETVGIASYYGAKHDGRRTASGERFDRSKLTAAHRTIAMGTVIEVLNLDNGRRVIARINDRGPFRRGRILDLSERTARELGFLREGTARVKIRAVPLPALVSMPALLSVLIEQIAEPRQLFLRHAVASLDELAEDIGDGRYDDEVVVRLFEGLGEGLRNLGSALSPLVPHDLRLIAHCRRWSYAAIRRCLAGGR